MWAPVASRIWRTIRCQSSASRGYGSNSLYRPTLWLPRLQTMSWFWHYRRGGFYALILPVQPISMVEPPPTPRNPWANRPRYRSAKKAFRGRLDSPHVPWPISVSSNHHYNSRRELLSAHPIQAAKGAVEIERSEHWKHSLELILANSVNPGDPNRSIRWKYLWGLYRAFQRVLPPRREISEGSIQDSGRTGYRYMGGCCEWQARCQTDSRRFFWQTPPLCGPDWQTWARRIG